MKRLIAALFAMAVAVSALADSYITSPTTGERRCKWDGTYIMKPTTGERLFKFDGTYLMKPATGERLSKVDGTIAIPVLIAYATGLL